MRTILNFLIATAIVVIFLSGGRADAASVTIDPGNFVGEWDMDLDGVFHTGVQTLELDEGSHLIRPGGAAQVLFNVDAAGNVTLAAEYDGVSAIGGAGTLDLLTIPVTFDPGDYLGKWGISRTLDPQSGSATVELVPTNQTNHGGSIGGSYRLYFGLASSAIHVHVSGDGSMMFTDGPYALASAAFDAAGSVRFRNVDITINDRDNLGIEWIINQVTASFGEPGVPIGNQTLTLVPDVNYQMQANGIVGWFDVNSPCTASPDELDLGGAFFDLSCGSVDLFANGNLFVADSNVKVYDAAGNFVRSFDDPLVGQSGDVEFNYVRDVLYVADRQGGEVFVFDRYGELTQIIGPAPGETVAWGTAIDATGTAYVVGAANRVNVFDNDGNYLRTITGGFSCCAIQAALSPDDTTLYVTETSGFNRGIHAWDLSNGDTYLGVIGDTASQISLGNGIAVAPDGSIYVGDGGIGTNASTLEVLGSAGNYQSTLASGLNAVHGVAVDGSNNIWVTDTNTFVTGQEKILGFDVNGNSVGSVAPYPEVGQPVGLAFYLPAPEPVEITYTFDFEITTSRYLGTDPSIAALLPALGVASGEFTYDANKPGVPSPVVGTDYAHSPAGVNGLMITFTNGVAWSTSTSGDFNASVIDRMPGSGADVVRFSSGEDSDLSVGGLTTTEIFLQFVEPTGSKLTNDALPVSFELAEWPGVNNIDLRAIDGNNSEFRIFGTLLSLQLVGANEAPVADAGADQSIRVGDTVLLDGSSSFDDNTSSQDLIYTWSFASLPAGSTATLVSADTATPSFVADIADTYVIDLLVEDEGGLTSIADQVVVSADNLAPTAVAGDDQLVIVGNLVMLDGSASGDPESDPLTYNWTMTSAPVASSAVLSGESTVQASFIADTDGVFTVSLEVSDAIGPGAPDSVNVTVTTAQDYSESQILDADTIVVGLNASQVTTGGNQNALSNFLEQAVVALQDGDTAEAIQKLEKALKRTDGCPLRGSPDGNGQGRDWITDCAAQTDVYNTLSAALAVLDP